MSDDKKKPGLFKTVITIFAATVVVITFGILSIVIFISNLAIMPAEGNLIMADNPELNEEIKNYIIQEVNKNNPETKDYYGNDKAYLNEWPIVQSIALSYFISENIAYDEKVKNTLSNIAYDIRPILKYKESIIKTIHRYSIEKEVTKYRTIIDPTTGEKNIEEYTVTIIEEVEEVKEEKILLLTEADNILRHHRYSYKETTETVDDGEGGTYTYIYEEVSSIEDVGEPQERIRNYISVLLGLDDEEKIEEAINFITSTNYAYENSIENKYLTGDGDYEYGSYVPSREVYKDIPIVNIENTTREDVVEVASSLLTIIEGKPLPYFWGGKYPHKGVNVNWGKPRPIQAKGNYNWPVGTILPLGLDCSGFVDWVYMQVAGVVLSDIGGGGGAAAQYYACKPIRENELKPGDLGFLDNPYKTGGSANHVGIYIGRDKDGEPMFIHCGGTTWRDKSDSFYKAGRVTISKIRSRYNDSPPVPFKYFGRPPIKFKGE